MRHDDDFGFHQLLQRGENGSDASVIEKGLGRRIQRAVDVNAKQHCLAVDMDVVQGQDLGHWSTQGISVFHSSHLRRGFSSDHAVSGKRSQDARLRPFKGAKGHKSCETLRRHGR